MIPPNHARSRMGNTLRALAALLASLACVPGLNLLGGELALALALPRGGGPRLAWDLGWLLVSVFAAVWVPARWSPLWPRVLALGLSVLMVGGIAWAAWTMGADYPLWFVAALLVGAPLAAGAALVIAARAGRVA